MALFWQRTFVLVAVMALLMVAGGCASRQRDQYETEDWRSIERPAAPLEQEESLSDKIGEAGVVVLVMVVVIGAILVPIFLFGLL
jgi:hypothetical protein